VPTPTPLPSPTPSQTPSPSITPTPVPTATPVPCDCSWCGLQSIPPLCPGSAPQTQSCDISSCTGDPLDPSITCYTGNCLPLPTPTPTPPSQCNESCQCFGCPGCSGCCPCSGPCCDSACVSCGDCGSCVSECGCISIVISSIHDPVNTLEAENISFDTLLNEIHQLNNDSEYVESAIAAATYMGMFHATTNTVRFSPSGRTHYINCLQQMINADKSNYAFIIENNMNIMRNEIKIQRGVL
ncbi:hypothetical protein EBU95_19570, partial [bacterium]|nr:hypothetical protein [bacterium]